MTVAERKREARQTAFALRKAAHAAHRVAAAEALKWHLSALEGRIVAGYLPIRTEADPLPAMEALAWANRVAVPVVIGAAQPLAFREWTPGCALERGPFDVMVPADGATLVPDVVIVPLVAFDRRLFRLGYGGGFYDRTLQALRSTRPVQALGFAYGAQCLDHLPVEETDQPLDELVTETGPFRPAS